MSQPACDSCAELRDRAPEFILNGVTNNVANSLSNNRGLSWNSNNCDDLQDVVDCLIGRKTDELKNIDVCDMQDFLKQLGPNLYETLKAMVMNDCGIWSSMCAMLRTLLDIMANTTPKAHGMTPTASFSSKVSAYVFNAAGDRIPVTPVPVLNAEIRSAGICDDGGRIGMWNYGIGAPNAVYPGWQFHYDISEPLTFMEPIGTIQKSVVVPTYMTEAEWNGLMRGFTQSPLGEVKLNGEVSMLYATIKGYVVDAGGEWNTDIRDQYGEGVGVLFATDHLNSSERYGSQAWMAEQRYVNVYRA